jgi:8-oxo-dGTP diphosphatase
MAYIACDVLAGDAIVADNDELVGLQWCDGIALATCVPYPLHGPVQDHLNARLDQ